MYHNIHFESIAIDFSIYFRKFTKHKINHDTEKCDVDYCDYCWSRRHLSEFDSCELISSLYILRENFINKLWKSIRDISFTIREVGFEIIERYDEKDAGVRLLFYIDKKIEKIDEKEEDCIKEQVKKISSKISFDNVKNNKGILYEIFI